MENTKQSMLKRGNLNPMWGKRHSTETKEKISNSQKARYNAIKKAIAEQNIYQYADTSLEARKEVLRHLLDNCELTFNSVQQVVNFLAILLGKDRIQEIIKAEINKLIAECYKVGNNKTQQ